MHQSIAVVQNILAYAKFPNPDMRKAATAYLNVLGDDLSEVEYVQTTDVDEAIKEIEQVMTDIDNDREELDAVLASDNVDEEDDDIEYVKRVENDN